MCPTFANPAQTVVIVSPRCFKERRQIEQRCREDLALDQKQGYEQASDPAVAIKKRVNAFELVVSQRNGHERRQGRFMQELFPGRETRLDISWRGSTDDKWLPNAELRGVWKGHRDWPFIPALGQRAPN